MGHPAPDYKYTEFDHLVCYTFHMPNENAPDSYNFIAGCPYCKESRGVSCSRNQAATGEPIEVYAIQCDHSVETHTSGK